MTMMKYLISHFGIGYGVCIWIAGLFTLILITYNCWEYREEIAYWVVKQSTRWAAWYEVTFNDAEDECPDWADPKLWRESLR